MCIFVYNIIRILVLTLYYLVFLIPGVLFHEKTKATKKHVGIFLFHRVKQQQKHKKKRCCCRCCCHKTSHLSPDVYPPPRLPVMPQCVWEGEGDLTRGAVASTFDRPGSYPVTFRCGQGTPDIGRGNLLPWVSLGSCQPLFGGCFWFPFCGGGSFEAPKMDGCVFFLFGGRGPEGISDGDVKKNLPNCEKWFTVQKAENKGIFNWWLN